MAGELEGAQKALLELSKSLKNFPSDPAPTEIHRLRTASRRAEVIAGALVRASGGKSRRFIKSLEPVRKAAGEVRDMDVLAANARRLGRRSPGESLARLIAHLENAREQNAQALGRALDRRRKTVRENRKEYSRHVKSVLTAPKSALQSGSPGQPQQEVQAAATRVVRELGDWAPLDAGNIHEFRLKVKELRYILQLDTDADAELVDALGTVQKRIGDWHDWQQLDEIAREVLHDAWDGALLERIDETTKRKFTQALKSANGLRAKYLAMPIAQGI